MKGMLDVSLSDIHSICSKMGDFSTDQSEGIYLDEDSFLKEKMDIRYLFFLWISLIPIFFSSFIVSVCNEHR